MPRFNTILNSLQFGELSPKFMARTDTEQYQKGAQKIENMIVLPSGGATRRPGSLRVTERTGLLDSRLMTFSFAKDEVYCFWMFINTDNDIGMFPVSPVSFQSGVVSAGAPSPMSGSTDNWVAGELKDLQWVQTGDVVIFSHKNHPPLILKRAAADSFSLGYFLVDLEYDLPDGDILRPYRDVNVTATTITIDVAAVGTGRTLTATTAIFNSSMVGVGTSGEYNATYFKITLTNGGTTTTGVCQVTAVAANGLTATVNVLEAFHAALPANPSDNWQESAWSPYRGFPATVGLFEGRLVFGGNTSQPDTVWASQVFNIRNFMQAKLSQDSSTDASGLNYFGAQVATDPFSFNPSAREVNRITWIQGGRTLAIGTLGQEFVGTGGTERVLSAEDISFTDQTTVGSSAVQAIRVNKAVVFVSRDGKKLYQYTYDNDSQSYMADNLTAISDQIVLQSKLDELENQDISDLNDSVSQYVVRELHWQGSRSCLWAVTSSGHLIGMTWDQQVKTLAWHRHILGGYSDSEYTIPAHVLSAAVVTSEDGSIDNLWLLVQRFINGSTYHMLEIIGPDYQHKQLLTGVTDPDDGEMPIYMDSAIVVYNATPTTTITGLDHLKGQDVEIIGDGFYHQPGTVDHNTGELELARAASVVIVGLKYTPKIKLCPTNPESPFGSAQGMMMRVDRMTVRLYRTMRAIIHGPEESEIVHCRQRGHQMGEALDLFTGDKKVNVPMGPETRCELEITSDQPFPMTILGVVLRGQLNE